VNPTLPIRLFCSDLDGTLTGRVPAVSFSQAWRQIPRERRPILVYSTGRMTDDALVWTKACGLPPGDYLISGVGTAIRDLRRNRDLEEFDRGLARGWDPAAVRSCVRAEPGILPQARRFLHRYKSSWHWPSARETDLRRLRRRLDQAGLRATVVYSRWRDLDILPFGAGKGASLAWLCRRLDIPLAAVLVAGNSGNDAAMFALGGVRAIAVSRAEPRLTRAHPGGLKFFQATRPGAPGVVEGLEAHGLLTAAPRAARAGRCSLPPGPRGR
jgi:mannosylfructose-6-phosphate phosphatase